MKNQSDDLYYASAVNIANQIKNKVISPVEVVDHFLQRIEKVNPIINAFCTITADQARQEAKKAESAVMKGEAVGRLHGVPIAIKDLTPTEGIRTTFGSKAFAEFIPERDATYVRRVKEAGGIILGKTNTPEFGHKGTTDNALFGTTKNPWNTELTPGGSSGGSAAAVASGLVPLAEGSDGGGSIRIPASLCGIYGFKPTYGRIPFDGKPVNMFGSQHPFLHYGPLTRTVEDAALLFSVMAGPTPSDPYCLPDTGEDYPAELKNEIKNLRIAYSPNLGVYEVDHQVQKALEQSVEKLRELGCEVEEVELDFGMSRDYIMEQFCVLWFSALASSYEGLPPNIDSLLSKDVLTMIEMGQKYSAMEYKAVELMRTQVWHTVQGVFDHYDLLICPTLAVPPFSHTMKGPSHINGKPINPNSDWMLTGIFNLTGHPAASVPAAFLEGNLPVGMQVIGPRFADSLVLRLSYMYEQAYPWTKYTPNLVSNV
jgi:amidase